MNSAREVSVCIHHARPTSVSHLCESTYSSTSVANGGKTGFFAAVRTLVRAFARPEAREVPWVFGIVGIHFYPVALSATFLEHGAGVADCTQLFLDCSRVAVVRGFDEPSVASALGMRNDIQFSA